MKVTGVGMEIDVSLTPEEITLLGTENLACNARMWEVQADRPREVPFMLSTRVEPKMEKDMRMERCYHHTEGRRFMPLSRKIEFYIGSEMYEELTRQRFACSRFSSDGKLKVFDVTKEREVYR